MNISVITVAYNSAATIRDTLESVAAQTHANVEHLVIDGASQDGTLDIVRRSGTRVAAVLSEPDRGIYDAMNKGLALATGELVGFLNADDVYACPDTLSIMSEALTTSGAESVYGDLVYVRSDNLSAVVRYWRSGPFQRSMLRYGWMPPHPTFYVRRALIQSIGGFDACLRIAADYDFMLRCLSRPGASVVYLPEVLVRMRSGGASNSSMKAMWHKSREDLLALRRNQVGGWGALACKNLRKLPQWLNKPKA